VENILYIQPYASHVGGVDTVLLQLIEGLDKKKYKPFVILPAPSPYVEKYEALGADVLFETLAVFGKPTSWSYYAKNSFNLFISMYKIRKIIKKYKINLVHSHKMELMGGNIVGKFMRVPTVQTIHELPRNPLIAYKAVGFLNHLFNDKVIVLCERSQTVLQWGRFTSNKVKKIYNGIAISNNETQKSNLRTQLNIKETDKLVITVARLSPMKGIEYLIKAAKKLKIKSPNIKIAIVGDVAFDHEKPYKQQLLDLVKRNQLENTVFFLGLRRDVPSLLEVSDLFVLPSVYDIFPTVILEAMSKGLPVVATDVGGVPEMVDYDTGIIVKAADPEELAKGILTIFQNDYVSIGKKGRERMLAEFTQKKYVENTVSVYTKLLQKGS
jgi:glycosyltransferase involved in cell wall biosynthesis